jgi:hypothetical protein
MHQKNLKERAGLISKPPIVRHVGGFRFVGFGNWPSNPVKEDNHTQLLESVPLTFIHLQLQGGVTGCWLPTGAHSLIKM